MHNRTMHVDDVVVSGNSGWSVIAELASYHQGNLEIVEKMPCGRECRNGSSQVGAS